MWSFKWQYSSISDCFSCWIKTIFLKCRSGQQKKKNFKPDALFIVEKQSNVTSGITETGLNITWSHKWLSDLKDKPVLTFSAKSHKLAFIVVLWNLILYKKTTINTVFATLLYYYEISIQNSIKDNNMTNSQSKTYHNRMASPLCISSQSSKEICEIKANQCSAKCIFPWSPTLII